MHSSKEQFRSRRTERNRSPFFPKRRRSRKRFAKFEEVKEQQQGHSEHYRERRLDENKQVETVPEIGPNWVSLVSRAPKNTTTYIIEEKEKRKISESRGKEFNWDQDIHKLCHGLENANITGSMQGKYFHSEWQ